MPKTENEDRALKLAQANAANIETLMKAVSKLTARLDRIALDNAGLPGVSPDEPLVAAIKRELAAGKVRQVGTLIVRPATDLPQSLDELFKFLANGGAAFDEDEPETFEEAVTRILKEFARGCSNGKPGGCEECLEGAVRAIVALREE